MKMADDSAASSLGLSNVPIPTNHVLEWNGDGFADVTKPSYPQQNGPSSASSGRVSSSFCEELKQPSHWSTKIKVLALVTLVLFFTALGLGVGLGVAAANSAGSNEKPVTVLFDECPGEPCSVGECRSAQTGECGFGREFCNINTTWAATGCCSPSSRVKTNGTLSSNRRRELRRVLDASIPTCDNPVMPELEQLDNLASNSSLLAAARTASCGNWYDYLNPCCWGSCPAGNMFDECSPCCSCNSGLTCSNAAVLSGKLSQTCLLASPPTPSVSFAPLAVPSAKLNTPIRDVRFLYAHDAMTTYFDPNTEKDVQALFNAALTPFVVTQPFGTVRTLLDCGARAMDLRVHKLTNPATVAAMNAAGFPAKLNDVVFEHGPVPIMYFFRQAMQDAIAWSNSNKNDDANLVLFLVESCTNCDSNVVAQEYTATGIPFVSASQLTSMTYADALNLARTKNNGGVLLGVTGLPGNSNFDENLRCRFYRSENVNCFSSPNPLNGMKSYMNNLLTRSHGTGDQVQALWQSPLTSAGGTTEFVLSGSTLSSDERNSALNYQLYKELIQNNAWRTSKFNLWKIDNICDWGAKLNERFRALNGFMNALNTDRSLSPRQNLISANGLYRFAFQADGNLVIYSEVNGAVIWSPNRFSNCPSRLVMQPDCNLVAYDCQNNAYYATGTNGRAGPCLLTMQDDRNLVLYGANGVPYWATGTNI